MNDPVRWGRIEAWLDLENPVHQLDRGMQQWRALLALGNGGPWGVGLGNGVEKFGTLTFAHIDFIFPVIGEELGLPFTLGVVFCYVLIAVAGCGIALQAQHVFNRCLALGLTCVIVVPAIQNIAVDHRDAAQRRTSAAVCQLWRHQPGVQPGGRRHAGRHPPPFPCARVAGISAHWREEARGAFVK